MLDNYFQPKTYKAINLIVATLSGFATYGIFMAFKPFFMEWHAVTLLMAHVVFFGPIIFWDSVHRKALKKEAELEQVMYHRDQVMALKKQDLAALQAAYKALTKKYKAVVKENKELSKQIDEILDLDDIDDFDEDEEDDDDEELIEEDSHGDGTEEGR